MTVEESRASLAPTCAVFSSEEIMWRTFLIQIARAEVPPTKELRMLAHLVGLCLALHSFQEVAKKLLVVRPCHVSSEVAQSLHCCVYYVRLPASRMQFGMSIVKTRQKQSFIMT